ncbi:hypothetical protein [Sandaracinus amylolyticus]|uniref:Uncharacterized protein n=1 Tax=Sandaracinus amylolyticus TaxID=927083 RepID=A0A0F6YEY1_9BACT|nr:hypothetical protein [Sandaracinus amylolyticus]AKF02907.1 hypothetical protein DB32_000055 [Sandaracinus amylolyticus]
MSKSGGTALRVIGCFALFAVVSACVGGIGLVVGRHAIATAIARGQLAERGVECDERFAVELAISLDALVVAPTRCTLASGVVTSVEVVEPVTVGIASGAPTRVEGGVARIDLRGDVGAGMRGSGWGAMLDALAIPERIGTMIAGFGQLAAAGAPPITMRSVEITRAGTPMITMSDLRTDGAQPLAVTVSRAELPVIAGPMGVRAQVALDAVRSSATRASATMDATLDVDASLPLVGTVDEQRAVSVMVEGLDTDVPRWSLR